MCGAPLPAPAIVSLPPYNNHTPLPCRQRYPRLHVLINNAAQVRRRPAWKHLSPIISSRTNPNASSSSTTPPRCANWPAWICSSSPAFAHFQAHQPPAGTPPRCAVAPPGHTQPPSFPGTPTHGRRPHQTLTRPICYLTNTQHPSFSVTPTHDPQTLTRPGGWQSRMDRADAHAAQALKGSGGAQVMGERGQVLGERGRGGSRSQV